ncbi:MAG: GumC family protein [Terriglobia bacterium]
MLTGRQLGMEDYATMLRRRAWLVVIPLILGPIVALVIAKRLSPRYTSQSEILIDAPKVPTSFVPSVASNNLISRLATMEEQIRSRSSLQPIIERYGLYKSEINKVPMEELVNQMNDAILIKPVSFSNQMGTDSNGSNALPGFQISFTADTPQMAQAVCTEVTSKFIDANIHLETTRAEGTADFIAVQLQGAKQKLDEQDAKLAAFKRQYFGSLPDQEQSTVQLLSTLSGQLNSLAQQMSGYQQQQTYTESILSQQVQAWKSAQAGGNNPQTLEDQLDAAEQRLAALHSQFTDNYPDVIKAQQDVDALKKRLSQQETLDKKNQAKPGDKPANPAAEPPQIRQLRASLSAMQDAIKFNQSEQSKLRGQIATYESKLRLTPAVEQQYKDLTRDYQTTLNSYDSLLAKEDQSQMATSLERRQEGEQFTLLDPASLPNKPSFPNNLRFAGGGVVVGLIIGFGLVLALEMRDKALRDERDVEFFMGVPTLALIPALPEAGKGKLSPLRWKDKSLREAAKLLGR